MPRPSLKQVRREQILDAYEICLIRYGVEGTTMDRVAKEAGLARPLIRHNVGNRDDLLQATVERFIERSDVSMRQMIAALPRTDTLITLIDWLFDPASSDSRTALISAALVAASANDPNLARTMREWTRGFLDYLSGIIRGADSTLDDKSVSTIAAGLVSLYFSVESLSPVGPMSDYRAACKDAARRLVEPLNV